MGNFFDHATVIVGLPRHGKTTIAKREAFEHLARHERGLVLAHDPNRQFVKFRGRKFCAAYDSVEEWKAKRDAATAKREPFPRGASIGGSAAAVRDAAVELGRARNRADNVRVPIMLVFDESSLLESSGSSHIGKEDVALLSNRAHWGIATVYNVQRPTALTEAFYTMATDVYVFAQPSERRTAILEDYLGLREGSLAPLVGARKFVHVHWRSGEGLV